MLIDPGALTKLERTFEPPLSFLASLQPATLKKVRAAAQLEYYQVDRLISGGGYGHNRRNSELKRLYWLHESLFHVMGCATFRLSAVADGVEWPQYRPEPDTTYTLLNGLSTETLTRVKTALISEAEPLRMERHEGGAAAPGSLGSLRFSILNQHLAMVDDIFARRGYNALAQTNHINEQGALDYDPALLITE
jgi:hypothetical protein